MSGGLSVPSGHGPAMVTLSSSADATSVFHRQSTWGEWDVGHAPGHRPQGIRAGQPRGVAMSPPPGPLHRSRRAGRARLQGARGNEKEDHRWAPCGTPHRPHDNHKGWGWGVVPALSGGRRMWLCHLRVVPEGEVVSPGLGPGPVCRGCQDGAASPCVVLSWSVVRGVPSPPSPGASPGPRPPPPLAEQHGAPPPSLASAGSAARTTACPVVCPPTCGSAGPPGPRAAPPRPRPPEGGRLAGSSALLRAPAQGRRGPGGAGRGRGPGGPCRGGPPGAGEGPQGPRAARRRGGGPRHARCGPGRGPGSALQRSAGAASAARCAPPRTPGGRACRGPGP